MALGFLGLPSSRPGWGCGRGRGATQAEPESSNKSPGPHPCLPWNQTGSKRDSGVQQPFISASDGGSQGPVLASDTSPTEDS